METEIIDQASGLNTNRTLYRNINTALFLVASVYYLYLFGCYFDLKHDGDKWMPYYVVNYRYGAEVYKGFVFTLGLFIAQGFTFFNKYLLSSIIILLAFIASCFAPRLMMIW